MRSRSRTGVTCSRSTTRRARHATTPLPDEGGGFDLWDVSDPSDPQPLVRAAGDYGGLGKIVCCSADATGRDVADRPPLPLGVHVARRGQGLPRGRRQRRAGPHRHRHLRHHRPDGARRGRRVRPRRQVRHRRHGRLRQRRFPPDGNPLDTKPQRHGREGGQRRPDDARVLLGRGLRAARHERPGGAAVHRRQHVRHRRPADRPAAAVGERAPGRVLARQPVHPRRR